MSRSSLYRSSVPRSTTSPHYRRSRSVVASAALAVVVGIGPSLANVASWAPLAYSQESALAEFYGEGVHAFHSHNHLRAEELLSYAIDGGLNDPRAFYFRGLARLSSGREHEAQEDFRTGATLEAQGSSSHYVSRALTRIQGPARLTIEKARVEGRLHVQADQASDSQRRYSQQDAAGQDVLRAAPAPRPAPPLPGTQPAAPLPLDNDTAKGSPVVKSPDALPDANTDPFADDMAPTTTPAPGTTPAPVPTDPFSAPAGDNSDPFDSNPFGDSPF